ncbi:MAG: T9SS type A sorting domain-containing protein [Flavobacteriales bacterium]
MRSPHYAFLFLGLLPLALHAQTEVEPNDLVTQANFWPENTTVSGTSCLVLGGTLDEDWYMLIPSEEGKITVSVIASNNTAGFYGIGLQFFQEDGTSLMWNTSAISNPVPVTSEISTYCFPNDTIYLKAAVGLDHCEYYTISYTITPPAFADDAEDNDDLANAAPLAENTWTEGRIVFTNDDGDDYYSVVLPQSGRYTQTIEATYQTDGNQNGGMNAQLLDVNGALAANLGAQLGANTVLTTVNEVVCAGPGTYYVHIAWGGNGCGIAYRLKWELEPTVFANDVEPNNTAQQAIVMTPDVPQEGFLWDVDWYKLYKPYSGDLQLTVRSAFMATSTGDMVVQVFNTAQQLIYNGSAPPGQNNVPSTTLITVAAAAPDSFYVQVFNNSLDCGSYELSNASTYVGIRDEMVASPISVMPNPSSDVFLFRFSKPMQTLQVRDMQGRAVVDVRLHGLASYTWDARNMPAGTYVVQITDATGSASMVRLVRTP